jgi:hypothetical protein
LAGFDSISYGRISPIIEEQAPVDGARHPEKSSGILREGEHVRFFKRLDRMSQPDERIERDLALLGQSFATFVQYWFAVTPLPSADVEKARLLSRSRFQSFAGYVSDQFARGSRFLSDLAERALGPDADVQASDEPADASLLDSTDDSKENGA